MKRFDFTRYTLAVMLMSLVFCVAVSYAGSDAAVTGLITDHSGAVVPGATVVFTRINTNVPYTTQTNGVGIYSLPTLLPGVYRANVSKDGFKSIVKGDIELHVQDQLSINFELQVGSVSESITVEGGAPMLNTESATVSTVVDRQFVGNIPLNGRSFQSLVALTPGVIFSGAPSSTTGNGNSGGSGQFSVNGQRSDTNSFTVDGVSANSGTSPGSFMGTQVAGNLPGLTALGTTQSLASVDDMQEFRIQTSNFSAEYGRQPGGQIAIVTRSGTNSFHGALFEYLRNNMFDAEDWFADSKGQAKPPERQNDFGFSFGGPVIIPHVYNSHDRTFFFVSYEGLRLRLPTFTITNVPTACFRGLGSCAAGQSAAPAALQPLLQAFPLPNGKDLGNGTAESDIGYSNPASLNATSIRIDHMLTEKWSLFGRYNEVPSLSGALGAYNLAELSATTSKTRTVTLGLTGALSPHNTEEFRFGYTENVASNAASFGSTTYGAKPIGLSDILPQGFATQTAGSTIVFAFPGYTSASYGFQIYLNNIVQNQSQFNIVNNFSHVAGNHQLKFGVDWRRIAPYASTNADRVDLYYLSEASVLNNKTDALVVYGSVPLHPIFTNFSAYVQDSWKVSQRLTLDIGLRWDLNPAMSEANGHVPLAVNEVSNLATMQLVSYGRPAWNTTYNNFAPRIGVAYQVSQTPGWETVVRGGFGVFYDTGNAQAATALQGADSWPFYISTLAYTSVPFPLTAAAVQPITLPNPSNLTPPYGAITVFDPNLKLPYTLQWNLAVSQSLGHNQALTLTYVGNAGRRLLQEMTYSLAKINPNFTTVQVTTNSGVSNYDALQAQFRRQLSHGFQALASYSWSHALDVDSTDNGTIVPVYGNSFYDVRQTFSSALTYDISVHTSYPVLNAVFGDWSAATTFMARTGFPVDLVASMVTNPLIGTLSGVRPNVVAGQPLYIYNSAFPGGRRINPAAFSVPAAGQFGDLGRNVVRGLGMWEQDLALMRQFKLGEKLKLELRAEAFNIYNHPNFGAIQTTRTAANFGEATNMLNTSLAGAAGRLSSLYSSGGPRSLQFALSVSF